MSCITIQERSPSSNHHQVCEKVRMKFNVLQQQKGKEIPRKALDYQILVHESSRGIPFSKSSIYNPLENEQTEKLC